MEVEALRHVRWLEGASCPGSLTRLPPQGHHDPEPPALPDLNRRRAQRTPRAVVGYLTRREAFEQLLTERC